MRSEVVKEKHRKAFANRTLEQRSMTKEKLRSTYQKHYGVDHPMLDPNSDYRQQRNKTMIERYGDVVPTKSEIVKEKTRLTCEKRFGVPYPMMNDIVKTKMIESLKQNDLQAIAVRRLETMKRNNSFKKSRPEEKFYQLLIERFGEHDIERNKRPDGTAWPIDFYIKSIDIWLQVDGIYWHGLDGHLDQHRQNIDVNKRSKIIVYKWETDRKHIS